MKVNRMLAKFIHNHSETIIRGSLNLVVEVCESKYQYYKKLKQIEKQIKRESRRGFK